MLLGWGLLYLAQTFSVQTGLVPLNLTLQVVLWVGFVYPARLSIATIASYVGLYAMGNHAVTHLPVTFGYWLGFMCAAWGLGIYDRRRTGKGLAVWLAQGACAVGVVYVVGWVWLVPVLGAENAWWFGVAPFIFGDSLKLLAGVLIAKRMLDGKGE